MKFSVAHRKQHHLVFVHTLSVMSIEQSLNIVAFFVIHKNSLARNAIPAPRAFFYIHIAQLVGKKVIGTVKHIGISFVFWKNAPHNVRPLVNDKNPRSLFVKDIPLLIVIADKIGRIKFYVLLERKGNIRAVQKAKKSRKCSKRGKNDGKKSEAVSFSASHNLPSLCIPYIEVQSEKASENRPR